MGSGGGGGLSLESFNPISKITDVGRELESGFKTITGEKARQAADEEKKALKEAEAKRKKAEAKVLAEKKLGEDRSMAVEERNKKLAAQKKGKKSGREGTLLTQDLGDTSGPTSGKTLLGL